MMADGKAAASEEEAASRLQRLESFSQIIKNLRTAAIQARQQSGNEVQWQEDEEFYESIDRSTQQGGFVKPRDFGGTGAGGSQIAPFSSGSSVFIPLTRPYVDIGAARISDIYMPTDDSNWDGEPTEVPSLIKALKDTRQMMGGDGQPAMVAEQGQDGQQVHRPVTVADKAKEIMAEATTKCEKAKTQIRDWLEESGYNRELRKCIHDMAKIGVCVMKGPYPKSVQSRAVLNTENGIEMVVEEKIIPFSKRVDPWDFYPAADCGQSVNKGSHVFEKATLTRGAVRELKSPGMNYIVEQLDKCLEEGPVSAITGTKASNGKPRGENDMFEVWYMEGEVEWQDLADAGCDCGGQKGDVFGAVVTMINERVVKASLRATKSKSFSYDVCVWQGKSDTWIGDGIGRQGRTAQKGINAGARALQDNMLKSSRPHVVVNRGVVDPGPDPWTWYMKGDRGVADVSHAFMFFTVPSLQVEQLNIINFYKQQMEIDTGMPLMLQGIKGDAPDTARGMEMMQNNAGIVPRAIVRNIDDYITQPHINRYYDYLLEYSDDDSMKGDFTFRARGSSALIERMTQNQSLFQVSQLALNPAYKLNPEKAMEEWLKSMRINPDKLKFSEEELQNMAQQQQPAAPAVQAAQIRAEAQIKVEEIQAKEATDHAVAAAQLELQKQRFGADEAQKDRALQLVVEQVSERIEAMKLTGAKEIALDQLKAMLAEASMKLSVQKDLSLAGHTVDLHKHGNPQVIAPAAEPVGRAPSGEAFTK